ncbi:hypothetical protein T492DRAFT_836497 [Pavlovales sp. CCMP2436]|nr:hypothetical protein T492DRAFT_836497 [Pavlovales sp. CCMP2436]
MNFIAVDKVISARKEARVTDLFAGLEKDTATDVAEVAFFDVSSIDIFATLEKSAAWSPTAMFLAFDVDYYQHADSGLQIHVNWPEWAAPPPRELWRAHTA